MFLELSILLLTLAIAADYFIRKRTNDIIEASGIPRPRYTLPIIGDILRFIGLDIKDSINLYNYIRDKYGKVCCLWSIHRCILIVQDVHFFEHILSSQSLIKKSFYYDMLSCWLGDGLLLSSGSKWHKRRKIITPTFHFKILEQFVEIFDQQGHIMVKKLKDKADGKTVVNMFPVVCAAALDIIAESAMGVKINAQGNSNVPYSKALTSVAHIVSNRAMKPLQYSNLTFLLMAPKSYFTLHRNIRIMHTFTEELINERRAALTKSINEGTYESMDVLDNALGLKKRLTFLDVLLQSTVNGQPLTNDDIREEVDTFTFEGHDTTTSGISNTLYLLARHPEVQQKVFEEIVETIGRDKEKPVRMNDLQDLKYLECVIKESMRLYPPVPYIGRETTEDTKIGNQTIPANTTISMSIYGIGRDPECFLKPEFFRPERFGPENTDKISPYAFVPFSAGPRNCIGQKFAMLEMKSTISCVIRHFELLPLGAEFEPIASLILRSATGVNLGLKQRIFN